jgi:pentatricopeptide repeat protein
MNQEGCKPNVVTYNSLIAACAHHGGPWEKAAELFDQMHTEVPWRERCMCVLACSSGSKEEEMHENLLKLCCTSIFIPSFIDVGVEARQHYLHSFAWGLRKGRPMGASLADLRGNAAIGEMHCVYVVGYRTSSTDVST